MTPSEQLAQEQSRDRAWAATPDGASLLLDARKDPAEWLRCRDVLRAYGVHSDATRAMRQAERASTAPVALPSVHAALVEYARANAHRFAPQSRGTPPGGWLGRWVTSEGAIEWYTLPFRRLVRLWGLGERRVLQQLLAEGRLVVDTEGRLAVQRRRGGHRYRAYVVTTETPAP